MAEGHYTAIEDEGRLVRDGDNAAEEARKLHHLATADPEPERADGLLTGPAHEAKYGLERAEGSAELWRGVGVHPTENRALVPGEDGAENLRGAAAAADSDVAGTDDAERAPRTTRAAGGPETASAPRASDGK